MKYKFKAKDIKTGEWVEGDLTYVTQCIFKKGQGVTYRVRPMIVKLFSHGGLIWTKERYFIDESTLELLKKQNTDSAKTV